MSKLAGLLVVQSHSVLVGTGKERVHGILVENGSQENYLLLSIGWQHEHL